MHGSSEVVGPTFMMRLQPVKLLMHGSSEVVGPTFMMRLQPFDRRRMTGFAVGLSLCGGAKASVRPSFSRRSNRTRRPRSPPSSPSSHPRRTFPLLPAKESAWQRRLPTYPASFPAPSSRSGASIRGLTRANFRFAGPPRGCSHPFGRSEAGANVCAKSKRSEILLGENVQKEGGPPRGESAGKG